MKCPTCRSRTILVRSRYITPYLREMVRACANNDCGRIIRTHEEFVKDILPSVKNDSTENDVTEPTVETA